MATDENGKRGGGKKRAAWAEYLSLSTIGIEMGAALVVGLVLGWYLDRYFGTRPWLLVIFTALGIGAGFRNIIRVALEQGRANRTDAEDKTKDERDDEQ